MSHHHADHAHGEVLTRLRRGVLLWSLLANATLLVAEVIGGLVFSSLALLADAAHMSSDVLALGVALVAQHLQGKPASDRHTYGLQRAEVLAALLNGVLLLGLACYIIFESVQRIDSPSDVHGAGLLVVATLGLAVNIGSAVAIRRYAGDSLNMRGAYLHMTLDAVGSVGAILAGVLVVTADLDAADATISILIAVLIIYSARNLIRDSVHVLLEGTPRGIEVGDVTGAMMDDPAVEEVHHLHMWSLASDAPALSAHVVLTGDMSLHEAQQHGDRLRVLLASRFGIEHATLELECHPCDPPGR